MVTHPWSSLALLAFAVLNAASFLSIGRISLAPRRATFDTAPGNLPVA
jgi:hypothetical protein